MLFSRQMNIRRQTTHLFYCVLSLSFAACAFAQVPTPLEIVSETKLPRDVYDTVAIGGLNKDIQCDAEENVWIPGLRGYSDTFSSLVRFGPNKATVHVDIDRDRRLENGSIEYFSPLRNGGVLALVRTAAEYNELDRSPATPKRYADTYAVTFGPSGKISSIVQLRVPSSAGKITALARLKNGWLAAGYTYESESIAMQAYLFDPAGNFTKEVVLPENRTKSSRTGTAGSRAVFRPTALTTADGNVLVFRGFSGQLLYRFSETGKLLESKRLHPDGIDFASPRLIGNSLLVNADVPDEKIGDLDGIPIVRSRSAFPIFDLKTGKMTEVLTWMDQGTVGCFNGTRLLIFKEGVDTGTWRILTLEPAGRKMQGPRS